MLWFLLGIIVVLFMIDNGMRHQRESFISLPKFMGGKEVLNLRFAGLFNDETCAPDESFEGGLCYKPCDPGFYGRLTMCIAESEDRGAGTMVGLEDCPSGWNNDGLICREPITGGDCRTWWDGCSSRAPGWLGGGCIGGAKTECNPIKGGRLKGRLDGGGVCPGPQGGDKPERYQGMCYSKCPKKYPVPMPGMPYRCYKGGNIMYDRGGGKAPYMVRLGGQHVFLGRP
jgi:hypothetical protein